MRALIFGQSNLPHTASEAAWKGVLGIGGVSTGLGVSLAQVEAWLRVGSLAIGVLVGLATLASICLGLWKNHWKGK